MTTFLLAVAKGKKTWCGKVINQDLQLEFIKNSFWSKDCKGLLEFPIIDIGYYMTQDSYGREYRRVSYAKNNELIKERITKQELLKGLVMEDLLKNKIKRKINFTVIKPSVKNTAWEMQYVPIDDEIYYAENKHFYMISGRFLKKSIRYERNFQRIGNISEKKEVLDNMIYSKEKDNIKIVFEDEDRVVEIFKCP